MAKPDWEAIQSAYSAGVHSLREIASHHGVSEGAIRKRAGKLGWVRTKKGGTQKSVLRTDKKGKDKASDEDSFSADSESSPETKPEQKRKRKVVTNHPPFKSGNQYALKHGGYARRMLLSDAVIEDARALSLEDELFRLRAANLVAAENIGRWTVQLEDEGTSSDKRDVLLSNISAAESAMMRNTARIESIEGTIASIRKMQADTIYRGVVTDKAGLEVEKLRIEAGDQNDRTPQNLDDFYADTESS